MMKIIQRKWNRLWASLGLDGDGNEVFDDLVFRLTEPHRHYHGLLHILDMLGEFGTLQGRANDPDAIELMIWFHDAIYEPGRSDNEAKSADLAASVLKTHSAKEELTAKVVQGIRATVNHVSDDFDIQTLITLDLKILASAPRTFLRYEQGLQLEAGLESSEFIARRLAWAEGFLAKAAIFPPLVGNNVWEQKARANLLVSVKRLQQGVAPFDVHSA